MNDREMSLVEYINALGNTRCRAANEYCVMVERISALEDGNIYLDIQLCNAREQIADLERVAEEAAAVYESDAHATRTQALHWKNILMESLANALRAAGYLKEHG